jgi:hypothetical protein
VFWGGLPHDVRSACRVQAPDQNAEHCFAAAVPPHYIDADCTASCTRVQQAALMGITLCAAEWCLVLPLCTAVQLLHP